MAIALLLTLAGIAGRLISVEYGIYNFVPMGAIALYAGARLPRHWAFIVPMAAWIVSDLVIDTFIYPGFARGPLDPVRMSIYAWALSVVAVGCLAGRKAHPATIFALALLASLSFFFVSNFAEWAGGNLGYPRTAEGLMACYAAAIPFYKNTVLAELLGTCAFFGIDALAQLARRPAAVTLPVRAD